MFGVILINFNVLFFICCGSGTSALIRRQKAADSFVLGQR